MSFSQKIDDPSEQSQIHVLIVHFNTPDLTIRLVEELLDKSSYKNKISIHILDNCSTPENLSKIDGISLTYPVVTLDFSDQNIGFGAGINLLVSMYLSGDGAREILWILNPDTRIMDSCVDSLVEELKIGKFAIISPLIYTGENDKYKIWYCGGSISFPAMRAKHLWYGQPLANAPTKTFETDFITGAAPMMYVSTFVKIGGFSNAYFLYWEDAHFCWRAKQMGYQLGVVPLAHVWHAVGASSNDSQSENFFFWSARNRFVYAAEVGVERHQLILGRGALTSLRFVTSALLQRNGRFTKAHAALRGTYAGFKFARE